MTSTSTTPAAPRPARAAGRSSRTARWRGRVGLAAALVVAGVIALVAAGGMELFGDAVRKITLPLNHEDVIRQQAAEKNLDPALIAAVIYEESKFRDRTSPAGAKGLMQILPDTAQFIARKSGGTAFELRDLGTPDINIRYGSWYLRYLLRRYGDDTLAVAAYNAGETNVDRWVRAAGGPGGFDPQRHIPFKETRDYVRDVRQKRAEYRRHYPEELGL